MLTRILKIILRITTYSTILVILSLAISRLVALIYSRPKIQTVDVVTPVRAAIVFGAGLRRDGTPTPILRDRVATAAELYFSGKVEKLLMSGDNRFINYNEPGAMHDYAVQLGVPEEDIVLDYAGRRTYDTCYRAKHIFGLDEAIVVTQQFHLPRTVFTCNKLGLPAVGVPADRGTYRGNWVWTLREIPATAMAFWEVLFSHPQPVLGEFEPIFPPGTTKTES